MMEPRRPGSVLQVFDYFLALGTPRNLDAWLEPLIAYWMLALYVIPQLRYGD